MAPEPPERLRVLFVDDEQEILDGLRLALRAHAREWDVRFSKSAVEALEWLAGWPADVIVSDLRMSEMDGPTFLTAARGHVPLAMRIILSGHAEDSLATRGVAASHQWLTKPCERAVLVGTIERAASVRAASRDQRVLEALGGASSLPALPATYARLQAALADADVGAGEVAALVSEDPAIVARVLSLANSSFYGGAGADLDLRRAVTRIGLRALAELVLYSEVFETLRASSVPAGFSDARFQLHGRLVAELACGLGVAESERAHARCAGLLHEVGVLLLMRRDPDRFGRAWRRSLAGRRPLDEIEREVLGVTHAEVGAALLGLWGLPLDVVTAVAWHHEPWRAPGSASGSERGVLESVALADACVDAAMAEDAHDAWPSAGTLAREWVERVGGEPRLERLLLEARALLHAARARRGSEAAA